MDLIKTRYIALLALGAIFYGCQDSESGGTITIVSGDAGVADGSVADGARDDAAMDAQTISDLGADSSQAIADSSTQGGLPDAAPSVVEGRCVPGSSFVAGTAIFAERTSDWKLDRAEVKGNRMTVGDIDGDGYADLIVRRSGQRSDIFSDDDAIARRHNWVLRNRGNAFQDITTASGFLAVRGDYPLTVGRPTEVVAFGDVDNDGDLDAFSGLDSRQAVMLEPEGREGFGISERSELLLNDGTGVFTMAAEDHPLRRTGQQDVPSGASWVDYDLDGDLDLWMSQGGLGAPLQDRLFAGDGAGGFTDETSSAGLQTAEWQQIANINQGLGHTTAWSAVACDLNGDGYAELLTGSYGRAPNHLWQAQPGEDGVRYSNESVASGYAFDQDQSWDGNQFARCYCQSQRNAPGCQDVPAPNIRCSQMNWRHQYDREPFRNGGNSGATVCADLNNDGLFDLYTTEIHHWWAGDGSDGSEVLVNQGTDPITFSRPGRAATGLEIAHDGLMWDEGHITAGTIDFDNDGRQDLYLGGTDYAGNRGHLYQNVTEGGDPMFSEVSTADFFEHNRSHGMAVSDFDRDGDLDLIVGHSRARCDANAPNNCYETPQVRFFENILGNQNNWLQLDLVGGPGSNRAAIGAQVTVTAGERTEVQQVGGGYGHFGAQRDRVLHFGLGEHCDARVVVRWPDRARSVQVLDLTAGHRYRLVQGELAEVSDVVE